MIRNKILIIFFLICVLSGCAKKDETTTVATTTESVVATNDVVDNIIMSDKEPAIFDPELTMPIVKDCVLYGYLKINFIEKLGIWDINNYQANQNGVKHSYAINYHVELVNYIEEKSMINVAVTPQLLAYDGSVIGGTGYVGWSGFTETVELYDNTPEGNAEVILQPITADFNTYAYLKFDITDVTNEVVFDSVYVDLKCLADAPDGAQIKTIDDETIINSICGASYSIKFHDVYLEEHRVKKDDVLKTGDYKFFDFCYVLNYLNGPTNDTEVLYFDSFNNYAITKAPIMEVYSDQDFTKLYDANYNAERLQWANRSTTAKYINKFPDALYPGEVVDMSENRLVPDTTIVKPTYIRIVIKFPTEIKARTFDEVRDFNGRYLVYQLYLDSRILEEEPK